MPKRLIRLQDLTNEQLGIHHWRHWTFLTAEGIEYQIHNWTPRERIIKGLDAANAEKRDALNPPARKAD